MPRKRSAKPSSHRVCKVCGRLLSEYNPNGKCWSHSVPVDATGDFDPVMFQGLRRDERVRFGVGMECTMILGSPGGICSPGKNPIKKDGR